jgi:hypothetical protein
MIVVCGLNQIFANFAVQIPEKTGGKKLGRTENFC